MKDYNLHKKIVCRVLGWGEFKYDSFVEHIGLEYLKHRVQVEDRVSMISRTRIWWIWWSNQWRIREKNYVQHLRLTEHQKYDRQLEEHYLDLYLLEHDPQEIKVFPPRVVQRLIESEAIGKLTIKTSRGNVKAQSTPEGSEKEKKPNQGIHTENGSVRAGSTNDGYGSAGKN